jgi:membrane protein
MTLAFPPLRLRSALSLGGLTVRELAVKTWRAMDDHEIQTRAAAVSFYAMLAMVPFIGLVLTLSVQLLPDLTGSSPRAKGLGSMTVEQLTSTLEKTLPPEASDEIKEQIARLQKNPPVGLISIGLAITLWLASSLFVAVIDAMNRIYGVRERRGFIKLRLIAIFMTVVQAAILVGSLLAIVGSNVILQHLRLGDSGAFFATGALYFTVLVMVLLSFALTFYVAPDADQSWEWITPGSIVGSLLFLFATLLFRIYVHNFANYDKTYGPLGGVMVLLFWFWISSLILLGAAQVNKIIEEASPLGKNYGQRTNPALAPDFDATKPEPANP